MAREKVRPLGERELSSLRKALERKRDELRQKAREYAQAALHPAEERPAEEMDAATLSEDQAELLGLAEHERRLLSEVVRALTKVEEGTYGLSEESGRPIPIARLRALPWARRTAEEEELREHGLQPG